MPWTEIFRFFFILGFVNAIFFAILIFSKKERNFADKILGSWLIVLALQFLMPFLYLSNFEKYLNFVGYEIIIFTLHPIFIYNYIKSLTRLSTSNKSLVISFLPAVITIISLTPLFLFSHQERYDLIFNKAQIPISLLPGFLAIAGSYMYFLISGFVILKKHKNITLHLYSYHDNVDLLWLRRLLVSFTIIFILSIPVSLLLFYYDLSLALSDYIFYSTLVIFVFFLGYWGYQQGTIFNIHPEAISKTKLLLNADENDILEIYKKDANKITSIMQNKKPYLDPTLNLHHMAELTNMPAHHLSKVINKSFHNNFFEFVNLYRIEEFKLLVNDPKHNHLTLLGIAFECGFNSKSAFNRIFKEHTGITPRGYKMQNLTK